MNSEAYLQQLLALLPPASALDRSEGSTLHALLDSFAQELARSDTAGVSLFDEMDPRTTYEMLVDWETTCGLPSSGTIADRRLAVHAKITERGGQSIQYFIDLAAALGYTITISEFEVHSVDSTVDAPLTDEVWRFWFQVNAPAETVRESSVNDDVDTALRSWGNDELEAAINEDKPAHTGAIYAYG